MRLREVSIKQSVASYAGICYALLRCVGWAPLYLQEGLEFSWIYTLHKSWHSGWIYGRDILFTFGPYGFSFYSFYYPTTFVLTLLIQCFLTVVLASHLMLVLRLATRHAGIAMALFVLIIEILCMKLFDSVGFALLLVVLLVHIRTVLPGGGDNGDNFRRSNASGPISLHAAMICLALLSLAKFSFALGAVTVAAILVSDEVLRQRRFPWPGVTYLISFIVLWALAWQPIGAMADFLHWSLEISAGYSEAMAVSGPPVQILWFLLTCFLMVALVWRLAAGRWYDRLLPAIGLCAIFFLLLKAAFVRHDPHAEYASVTLMAASFVIAPLAFSLAGSRFIRGLALVCVASSLILGNLASDRYRGVFLPKSLIAGISQGNERCAYLLRVMAGEKRPADLYAESKQRIRRGTPLPPLSGSVDVYPSNQVLVLAHDLNFQPRPVFQSHQAYTSKLLEANAAWLRTESAPENIIFGITNIDNWYPSLADALSWPELLARYQVEQTSGTYLILKRNNQVAAYRTTLLAQFVAPLDEWIRLPADDVTAPIWCVIDIPSSLAGTLSQSAFKLPEIYIDIKLNDQDIRRFRFIPSIARTGFFISPLVETSADFAAMNGKSVREMRLWTEAGYRWAFSATYTGGFYHFYR